MMSAPTDSPLPREKPYRFWILLAVIFLVVLLPLLMVLNHLVSYRSTNGEEVAALEARIRANHEPLNLQELAATFPPIPDEENGAEVLLKLWEEDEPGFWRAFRSGATSLPERTPENY